MADRLDGSLTFRWISTGSRNMQRRISWSASAGNASDYYFPGALTYAGVQTVRIWLAELLMGTQLTTVEEHHQVVKGVELTYSIQPQEFLVGLAKFLKGGHESSFEHNQTTWAVHYLWIFYCDREHDQTYSIKLNITQNLSSAVPGPKDSWEQAGMQGDSFSANYFVFFTQHLFRYSLDPRVTTSIHR